MQDSQKNMDVDLLDGTEDWPLDPRTARAVLEQWELERIQHRRQRHVESQEQLR